MFKSLFFVLVCSSMLFASKPAVCEKYNVHAKIDCQSNHLVLSRDIEKYNLDEQISNTIINQILKSSIKFNVDPFLVYSVIWKESTFVNSNHKPIYFKDRNEVLQALGISGVIWEFWGEKLQEHTIVKNKELLNFEIYSIEACAYILGYFLNEKNYSLKKTLAKYYGRHNKYYHSQIIWKYNKLLHSHLY